MNDKPSFFAERKRRNRGKSQLGTVGWERYLRHDPAFVRQPPDYGVASGACPSRKRPVRFARPAFAKSYSESRGPADHAKSEDLCLTHSRTPICWWSAVKRLGNLPGVLLEIEAISVLRVICYQLIVQEWVLPCTQESTADL